MLAIQQVHLEYEMAAFQDVGKRFTLQSSTLASPNERNRRQFRKWCCVVFLFPALVVGSQYSHICHHGWFQNKLLYYGAYTSAVFKAWGDSWYNLPMAYLLGFGMTMVVTLVFIAYSLAKSHKKYYIEQSGLTGNYFFNKVFCGWDFAITNEKAARLQSKALQLDLKEQLASLTTKRKEETLSDKCITILRFILFHVLSLAALGGIGCLVYYLLENKEVWNKKSTHKENEIGELFLALIITAITLILPAIFSLTVKWEGYKSHRTQLRVAMFRSMLLILVVIGCPLYFWIDRPGNPNNNSLPTVNASTATNPMAFTYSMTITNTMSITNPTTSTNTTTVRKCYDSSDALPVGMGECWETEVGKELYRFVIVDFLVCVLCYFPVSWIRSVLYKQGVKFLGDLEFDVVWNTWNLLYNQTICWIGSFFCPLIPVIITIKFIITFYIRKFSVMQHFQPPTRIWRAHRNRTDFRIVTFSIVVLSMLGIGYVIVKPPPSRTCGPFQGQNNSYEIVSRVIETFGEKDLLGNIAAFITKPGCVALAIVALGCVAYYTRAVAKARLKMVQLLQEQVKMEGKDKVFLLHLYESALNSWHNRVDDGGGNIQFGSSSKLPNGDYNGGTRRWSQEDLSRNEPRLGFGRKDSAATGFQDSQDPVLHRDNSREELHRRNVFGDGIADDEEAAFPRNHYNPRENFQLDDRSTRSPEFHRSAENIVSPAGRDFSPSRAGAINPVYRDDSPYKSRTPPPSRRYRDPTQPFPGITHQPPFQNLGNMSRRQSKASIEDVRAESKRRPK